MGGALTGKLELPGAHTKRLSRLMGVRGIVWGRAGVHGAQNGRLCCCLATNGLQFASVQKKRSLSPKPCTNLYYPFQYVQKRCAAEVEL